MTTEAALARDIAEQAECKLDSLRRVQSGDWRITLTVASTDMPASMLTAPMGQRYLSVFVPIGDDESPQAGPAQATPSPDRRDQAPVADMSARGDGRQPWHELRPSQQAGIACQDEQFRQFIGRDDEQSAAEYVRWYCRVESRRELDTDEAAAGHWAYLYDQYRRGPMPDIPEDRRAAR